MFFSKMRKSAHWLSFGFFCIFFLSSLGPAPSHKLPSSSRAVCICFFAISIQNGPMPWKFVHYPYLEPPTYPPTHSPIHLARTIRGHTLLKDTRRFSAKMALLVAGFSLLSLAAGVALGLASFEHFLALASFTSEKVGSRAYSIYI